jgi:choline dehydrogenase-like flavoprotein
MYIIDKGWAAAASKEWDVIVVGAGAVGLIVSVSLARAGRRVLLMESGATEPNADQGELNEILVTGRPHLGATHGRARIVGGTTTLWGGQLTQFVPYDFDAREILADCVWPLRYDEIASAYANVAKILDLDLQYLTDESVQSKIKCERSGNTSGCEIYFTRWLRDPNLARWFADDLQNRARLTVAPKCHASQIHCGPDGSQVSGIEAICGDGERRIFRARDVVLACGTIEISRLLLLSAKKSHNVPWAQNSNIGRYFQDHLDLVLGQVELKSKKAFSDLFENVVIDGHKYQPKVRLRTSVLRELGSLNIACTVRFDSSIGEDMQMLKQFFRSLLTGSRIDKPWKSLMRMAALSHVWFPLIWRYVRHRRILAMADRGISIIAHCEQRPLKESRITLDADETDRFGDPLARLHWAVDEPLQMKSLQSFVMELGIFLRDGYGAKLNALPGISSGDLAVLTEATDAYHQCGGARMAHTEEKGVVDSNCKVFGTENLYVAGAAVFPSSSFANPTYTAMALAHRLSDYLVERHRHQMDGRQAQ